MNRTISAFIKDTMNCFVGLNLAPALRRTAMRSLAVGLLMAFASLFIDSQYRSIATILPEIQDERGGSLLAAAATLGIRAPGANEDPSLTFPDVLNSHWLGERMVTTPFEFSYRSGLIGPLRYFRQTLQDYFHTPNIDLAIQRLQGVMIVRRDIKNGVFTLAIETKSPELSQQAVRRALQLLEEFLTQRKNTRGKEKATFIRARMAESEAACSSAEQELLEFLQRNKNYRASADPAVQLKGAHLEGTLTLRRQVYVTLTLNLEQALQQEKDRVPTLSILDDGTLPKLKSRPSRMLLVLFTVLLAAGLSMAWDRRKSLLAILLPADQ